MKCALITAGGVGSRLYPLSTPECPKQFVKMFGNKSLLELTYKRINRFIKKENIFIVLPEKYKHFINELLPFVKEENIIIEPCQKSTAPCVLYACMYIEKLRKNANLFVFPADHYIQNGMRFQNTLRKANNFIQKNKSLIIFGIKPHKALDRYGYIKASNDKKIATVLEFKEKPSVKVAEEYLKDGNYFWSSDIACFDVNYMLKLFKKFTPHNYEIIKKGLKNNNIMEIYKTCDEASTAYAIYEKANNLALIKCNFKWDDVGVFDSLLQYTKNKNVLDAYDAYKKNVTN